MHGFSAFLYVKIFLLSQGFTQFLWQKNYSPKLSEFSNTICGISDSFVRFLHSDQNVRKAPDQATYIEYGEASLENVKV